MKTRVLLVAVTVSLWFLVAGFATAAEWYVRTVADLHFALEAAEDNGEDDVIMVARGTYYGNFQYLSEYDESYGISVLGGYSSDFTGRIVDPANTVLDGGTTGSVMLLAQIDGGDITVEGMTFRNGEGTDFAGGLHAQSERGGTISVTHCVMSNNSGGSGAGGAVLLSVGGLGNGGNVTFSENTVTGNSTSMGVAGAWIGSSSTTSYAGNVTVSDNIVTDNDATGEGILGAGLVASSQGGLGQGGDVTVTDNVVSGNSALGALVSGGISATSSGGDGGPVVVTGNIVTTNIGEGLSAHSPAEVTVSDNWVTDNESVSGTAGMSVGSSGTNESGRVEVSRNTVLRNRASGEYSLVGGISAGSHPQSGVPADVIITNNIVAENEAYFVGGIQAYSDSWDTTEPSAFIVANNTVTGNSATGEMASFAARGGAPLHGVGYVSV